MGFDKVIPEEFLRQLYIETQGLTTAVLDVLPSGEIKIVKSERFNEEESYAIIGEGYIPVGWWFPWAKKSKIKIKEGILLVPNTLYAFFPVRQSLFDKNRLNPSTEIRGKF